jgi:hypothetical protein
MAGPKKFKIFLSSPQAGLAKERNDFLTLTPAQDAEFSAMEWFPSSPDSPEETCLRHLEGSDCVVLLIGPLYGTINPKVGISYTQIEYERATSLGLKVFSFLKTPKGKEWQPEDEDAEVKKKHQAFFDRVSQERTFKKFSEQQQLRDECLKAISEYKVFEDSKKGPLVSYKDFFHALLRRDVLFSHEIDLVGRASELLSLEAFAKSERKVAVLNGRGGIGKSRLLLEFAKKQEAKAGEWGRVKFVRENFVLTTETISFISAGRSILIVDDAHRYTSLSNLLSVFNSPRKEEIKLVLSIRPRGKEFVDGVLAHSSLLLNEIERLPELDDLKKSDLEKIVENIVGDDSGLIKYIVNMTRDCPLASVIASKLIRDKKLHPYKITKSDEFQRAVLDKFIDELKGENYSNPSLVDKLLKYLSVLAPVRLNNEELRKQLSELISCPVFDVVKAFDAMEEKGILIRRGTLARLAPDLLSDHILHSACIAKDGSSTEFADHAYDKFKSTHAKNILKNIAEIEWRARKNALNVDLLSSVWEKIHEDFKKADHYERTKILEEIEESAFYQPDKALELVNYAIKTPARPNPKKQLYGDFWKHRHVLEKTPSILKKIAFNLEYITPACKILWEIGRADDRELNPTPQHPVRILKELAEYQVGKPLIYNKKVFAFLRRITIQKNNFIYSYTPLNILEEFLAKEIEESSYDEGTMSFRSLPLNYEAVKDLRSSTIELIGSFIHPASPPKILMEALYTLLKAMSYSHGLYGRGVGKSEQDVYLPEQLSILGLIKRKLKTIKSPCFRLAVRSQLRWFNLFGRHAKLKKKIKSIYELIPENFEYRLVRAVAHDFEEFINEKHDFNKQTEKTTKEVTEVAEILLKQVKNSHQLLTILEKKLQDLNNYKRLANPNYLLSQITKLAPELAVKLFRLCLVKKNSEVAKFCSSILWPLNGLEGYREITRTLIKQGLKTKKQIIYHNIAHSYAWGGLLETPFKEDIRNVGYLLKKSDDVIFKTVLQALQKLGQVDAEAAKKLAVEIDLKKRGIELDQFFEIYDEKYGIPFSKLNEAELKSLLGGLVKLNIFERQDFHVEEFLSFVCKKYPLAAVDFLIARYNYNQSIKLGGKFSRKEKYAPFPYLGFDTAYHGISAMPEYEKYLRGVRDLSLAKELDRFWLEKLFRTVSDGYSEKSLAVLREWFRKPTVNKLIGISLLVKDAEDDFMFNAHAFVAELILLASNKSAECLKRVRSNLFGIAISGGSSRSFGEVSAKSRNLSTRGKDTAKLFSEEHPAHQFYLDVGNYGDETMQQELAQDEETTI